MKYCFIFVVVVVVADCFFFSHANQLKNYTYKAFKKDIKMVVEILLLHLNRHIYIERYE